MLHKIILPTEDGWENFRKQLDSSSNRSLLCFTKQAESYDGGIPAQIHFVDVDDGDITYIPCLLDIELVLVQAPEEIFLVGISETAKANLRENWSVPEVLRSVIREEYSLQ